MGNKTYSTIIEKMLSNEYNLKFDNEFKILSQNSEGSLIQGEHKNSERKVAIRLSIFKTKDKLECNKALNMAKFENDQLVKIYDYRCHEQKSIVDNKMYYYGALIMQYYPYTIHTQLKENTISFFERIKLAIQVFKAIKYLNKEKKIIHNDIKPSNILIDPTIKEAYLTDFGLSKNIFDTKTLSGCSEMGTILFQNPQYEVNHKNNDMYGFGIALYYIIQNKHPIFNKNEIESGLLNPGTIIQNMLKICDYIKIPQNFDFLNQTTKTKLLEVNELIINLLKGEKLDEMLKKLYDLLQYNNILSKGLKHEKHMKIDICNQLTKLKNNSDNFDNICNGLHMENFIEKCLAKLCKINLDKFDGQLECIGKSLKRMEFEDSEDDGNTIVDAFTNLKFEDFTIASYKSKNFNYVFGGQCTLFSIQQGAVRMEDGQELCQAYKVLSWKQQKNWRLNSPFWEKRNCIVEDAIKQKALYEQNKEIAFD